jgi:hypothetical protein
MIAIQSSALAAQNLRCLAPSARHLCSAGFQTCRVADFQIGRRSECGRLAGLEARDTADWEVCATVPGPNAHPFLEVETTSMPALTGLVCRRFRVNPALKIEELPQKIKNWSSTLIKVNQGFFDEKNSEFFYGHFYGKSLANPQKIPQKTRQIAPNNTRFLTCLPHALIIKKIERSGSATCQFPPQPLFEDEDEDE